MVLGIPWEVDTDGLRDYMSKFGELEDCIVMKERNSGRSRGFGYVTFLSAEDAKHVLTIEHYLGNRLLEVKIATPKEEMRGPVQRAATRIFVARIPPSVTESAFRSYFEKYGEITDLYMPKDHSKSHRGIGFITFVSTDAVEDLMSDTHELGGSTVVVDRATPKDDDFRPIDRSAPRERSAPRDRTYRDSHNAHGAHSSYGAHGMPGGYGAYNAYISAATRYAALGAPTLYDHPSQYYGRPGPGSGSGSGSGAGPSRGMGKKIFVGRLPQEASSNDLRQYFGKFGKILDVYIPKDPKRSGHRGFGFVTFVEDGVADRVARRSHEMFGQKVAIDSAAPLDDAGPSPGPGPGPSGSFMMNSAESFGGYGGPMRNYSAYGRMYGSLDFDDWGYGMGGGGAAAAGARPSRADWRYRPY